MAMQQSLALAEAVASPERQGSPWERRLQLGELAIQLIDTREGRPLLLVHGFPDSKEVWRLQVPALVAAGFRVIAPDLRGFGNSEMPDTIDDFRLDKLVADLCSLLDRLGVERLPVVGHDWGAVIAWQFAVDHPERVEKLIALSVGHPACYLRSGPRQWLDGWYIAFFQLRGVAEALLTMFDWKLFRAFTGHAGEQARWKASLARPGRLRAALSLYRANASLLLRGRIARADVAVPVHGIWSSGDRFLTEKQMRDSSSRVRSSWQYTRLDGPGHWMQIDAPATLSRLLIESLRRPEEAS